MYCFVKRHTVKVIKNEAPASNEGDRHSASVLLGRRPPHLGRVGARGAGGRVVSERRESLRELLLEPEVQDGSHGVGAGAPAELQDQLVGRVLCDDAVLGVEHGVVVAAGRDVVHHQDEAPIGQGVDLEDKSLGHEAGARHLAAHAVVVRHPGTLRLDEVGGGLEELREVALGALEGETCGLAVQPLQRRQLVDAGCGDGLQVVLGVHVTPLSGSSRRYKSSDGVKSHATHTLIIP